MTIEKIDWKDETMKHCYVCGLGITNKDLTYVKPINGTDRNRHIWHRPPTKIVKDIQRKDSKPISYAVDFRVAMSRIKYWATLGNLAGESIVELQAHIQEIRRLESYVVII